MYTPRISEIQTSNFQKKWLESALPTTVLIYICGLPFDSCWCALCTKFFFFFFSLIGCPCQFVRISTNPTNPEINNHVNLQWPSYEQPHDSNLRSRGSKPFNSKFLSLDHHLDISKWLPNFIFGPSKLGYIK